MRVGGEQVGGGPLRDLGIALHILNHELNPLAIDAAGAVDPVDVVLAGLRDRDVGESADLGQVGGEPYYERRALLERRAVVQIDVQRGVHVEAGRNHAVIGHVILWHVVAVGHHRVLVSHVVIGGSIDGHVVVGRSVFGRRRGGGGGGGLGGVVVATAGRHERGPRRAGRPAVC